MNINQSTPSTPSKLSNLPHLHMFLVDTALELIPENLASSDAVTKNLAKFGNAGKLLDTTLHHTIMKPLSDSESRGRPDILHHYLLDTLGSIANFQGQLTIFFHISRPKSRLFQVNSIMQCPRDYHRFKALMGQLMEIGHIPPEPPYFITELKQSICEFFKGIPKDNILRFTKLGIQTNPMIIFQEPASSPNYYALIGGFQKGFFSKEIQQISAKEYGIYSEGLDSWVVINRILAGFEFVYNKNNPKEKVQ